MIGYKTNNLPWGCNEGEHHRCNYEISSFISWDTAATTMVTKSSQKLRGTAQFRQNHPPKASDFSDPQVLLARGALPARFLLEGVSWSLNGVKQLPVFFLWGIPPRHWEFPDPKMEVR